MDRKALLVASVTGAIAQIVLVIAGRLVPWIADNLFALGGLAFSVAAGVIYARKAPPGPAWSGGLASGAICSVVGVALAVAIASVPWTWLVVGALAGALGGLLGASGRRLASRRIARRPPR